MSNFEEHLFGRIAVLKGYLTVEQLHECLEIQRASRSESPPRIGEILRSKGYLTSGQLDDILDVRRKKFRKMLRNSEELLHAERTFRQHALAERLVSLRDMEAAVLEQRRLHRKNIQVAIWEVLVSRGALEVDEVFSLLARQGRRTLYCPDCDLYYTVVSYTNETVYSCKHCGNLLDVPAFLDIVVTDEVIEGGASAFGPMDPLESTENDDVEEVV